MAKKETGLKLLFIILAATLGLGLATVPVVQAAYEAPTAYWTLDQEVKPYLESISGSPNASTVSTPAPVWIDGQINKAQNLTGNANLVIPDDAVIDFATGAEFTIEFWMKHNEDPLTFSGDWGAFNSQVIISRQVTPGTFDTATWWVGLNRYGRAAGFFVDADGMTPIDYEELAGTTVLVDGNWHHIAVTRTFDDTAGSEDNTFRLYVDGELEDTMDHSGDNRSTGSFDFTGYLHLGDVEGASYYDGAVDNLAIYNDTALDASQVQINWATGNTGNELGTEVAPVFSGAGSGTAIIGYEASFEVVAGGNPIPTYSSTNLPDGAEVDGTTGVITWLPNDGQTGANSFDMVATNTEGTDTQAWSVTVEDLCTTSMDVYWRLDETTPASGTADYTGTADDGTCSSCPASAVGKVGTAYDFSGGDVDVSVASNAVFDFAAGADFSIELWMNLAAAPGGVLPTVMLGRWLDANTNWWVGVAPGGQIAMSFGDSDSTDPFPPTDTGDDIVSDGGWHHVVVVRDGTNDTLRLYVDGVEDTTIDTDRSDDDWSDASFEMSAPVTLGSADDSYYYGGLIDEVAIYNKALSAATIAAHAATAGDQYYCNAGPTIAALPTTATEGVAYTATATATDPEGNAVSAWALDSAPSGMTIDETTGAISWTPGDGVLTASVTVEAMDEYGATGDLSYTITVTPVDTVTPVITAQDTLQTMIGTALTIELDDLTVTDSDSTYPDDFTLTVQAGTNYTVSGATITPDAGFSGTLTVPVTVNDGDSDSAAFNLTVTVSDNASPEITSTAPTTATIATVYTYDAEATDADGDTLTWSLTGAPSGMVVDAATGVVTWTPISVGDSTFTLVVSDGNGGTDEEEVTVTKSAASSGGGSSGGGCFINATAGAQTGNGLFVLIAGLLSIIGLTRQRF